MITSMRKTFVVGLSVAIASVAFTQSVFAQNTSTTTPPQQPQGVTFIVTVGEVNCEGGKGTAQVNFANDPEVGGYYEVFGEMIIKDGIALSRNVGLPTGEYTWKGDINDGYYAIGPTNGSFIVPKCPQTSSSESSGIQKLSAPAKKTTPIDEVLKVEKKSAQIIGDTATTTDTIVLPPSNMTGGWGTLQTFIAVIAVLGLAYVFAGRKASLKK